MDNNESHSLTVLIAEDSAADRLILESLVSDIGHRTISAEDGQAAIDLFNTSQPDLILLDVMMPKKNGIEVARHIKEQAGDVIIPIIFLTSLNDTESLVECLDAGGDDFLPKPYNKVVIQSKIKALARMREMNSILLHQRDQIALHNQNLISEQSVAKKIFDNITQGGRLDLDNIRFHQSPLAVFNGDILLAELTPENKLVIFLGDFTGHGLPAAIGSLPLASTFYTMVRKGFTIADILKEINKKLNDLLPVGFFCCAFCSEIDLATGYMKVWSGGLPDSIIYRNETQTYETVPSANLPLGIAANQEFKSNINVVNFNLGDRLYLWSDGIHEARNPSGEMFGEERLMNVLNSCTDIDSVFDQILEKVHHHIGRSEKDDDISLVEITLHSLPEFNGCILSNNQQKNRLLDWSTTFTFPETSLRFFDPVALMISIISEVPGLRKNSSVLFTVMSELFNNALEHGILRLDSNLKKTPKGFSDYYTLRAERLADLESGYIRLGLDHKVDEQGGNLIIRIEDSGEGFDMPQRTNGSTGEEVCYFGRGLSLVNSICQNLVIHQPGNHIEAHFRWNYE